MVKRCKETGVYSRGIRQPGTFIYNLATTALTSFISLAATIVTTRLLAEGLGPDQFGAYTLARRLLLVVASIATDKGCQ